jgi:adenylylsulfate kinase
MSMFRESHSRSIAKAVSWRVLGTLATTALVYLFTRRLVLSLAVGTLEFVSKIGLFWFHERVWDRVRYGKKEIPPAVVWFTGLSGSGKSTIATRVFEELGNRGYRAERLDGDTVREIFPNTGFTRPERDEHIRRVGFLASRLERQGVFVVASFVSPYQEARDFVRSQCRNFIEVWVSTPLEECERRDVKGLYARARRGEIKNFTGIDDPYEPPSRPELTLDTTRLSVDEAVAQVMAELERHIART